MHFLYLPLLLGITHCLCERMLTITNSEINQVVRKLHRREQIDKKKCTQYVTKVKVENDHRSKFSNLNNWKEEA